MELAQGALAVEIVALLQASKRGEVSSEDRISSMREVLDDVQDADELLYLVFALGTIARVALDLAASREREKEWTAEGLLRAIGLELALDEGSESET